MPGPGRPSRRDDRHVPGRHRPAQRRGAAPPGAPDGVGRTAGRRRRARSQQPDERGDQRGRFHPRADPTCRSAVRDRRGAHPPRRRAHRGGDGAAPRVQPAAGAASRRSWISTPCCRGSAPCSSARMGEDCRGDAPARARARHRCAPTPGSSSRSCSTWRSTRATRCRAAARSRSRPSTVELTEGSAALPPASPSGPGAMRSLAVQRHGPRHGHGDAGPRLRAVLHHQGRRPGHGSRALDRVRHREAERTATSGRTASPARARPSGSTCPETGQPSDAAGRNRRGPSRAASGELVLVVEDEAHGAEVRRARAHGGGYPRTRGGERRPGALSCCARSGDRPALVLTDVVMPGMSGSELADGGRTPGARERRCSSRRGTPTERSCAAGCSSRVPPSCPNPSHRRRWCAPCR